MKFLTEGDLRDLYNNDPFTEYVLVPEARLTPGARQFLLDRNIKMHGSDSVYRKRTNNTNVVLSTAVSESQSNSRKLVLYSKMKSIEALFFLTVEELLRIDVLLAQKMIQLNKQYSCIKNALKNNCTVENLFISECTGINGDNFSNSLNDCFEITEFHIQLEKGREILLLHRLRCALQEIEPLVQALSDCKEEKCLYEDLVCKVNQIINRFSQLICSLIGGGTCQLKS